MTTIAAIKIVAAISTREFPESAALLITEPSPVTVYVWPLKRKYSAMMLAFQAPPDAVTNPVIK